MKDFPRTMTVYMVENGYLVSARNHHEMPTKEWVFRTASELGSWIRDGAPSYGLAGNAPPILPEVK